MTRMGQGSRAGRAAGVALLALAFLAPPAEASNHAFLLERGEVKITGETNLFPFSGSSADFEGCVRPKGDERFDGEVRVAMRSFTFDVPFAAAVIESETQFDTARFPQVKLRLDDLHPVPGKQRLTGELELRGLGRPVAIDVDVAESPTGIVVGGTMRLRQSDFGVTPFDWGLLRVADEVAIEFQAAFRQVEARSAEQGAAPGAAAACRD